MDSWGIVYSGGARFGLASMCDRAERIVSPGEYCSLSWVYTHPFCSTCRPEDIMGAWARWTGTCFFPHDLAFAYLRMFIALDTLQFSSPCHVVG